MKIVVDADACPVKDIIEMAAERCGIEVILVSNPHHCIQSCYATIVVVDGASQAADLAIINMVRRGDIVVTQDYGLASMVISRGCSALDPGGRIFSEKNIEQLLMGRFFNQKARRAGEKVRGPRKRARDDDQRFARSLQGLIEENMDWPDGRQKG